MCVCVAQTVKNLLAMWETGFDLLSWEIPGEWNGNPLQYSLPGDLHGQRSLVGYSPWGHKTSCIHMYIIGLYS